MPIQFRRQATHYNQHGTLVTTVRLVTRQALESQFKQHGIEVQSQPEPISELLRRGETHISLPNRFSTELLFVSLQELLQEHEGEALEELFVIIQNTFQPNPDEALLYPRDMVDEYRRMGVPETTIQALLLKADQTTRDSKKDNS